MAQPRKYSLSSHPPPTTSSKRARTSLFALLTAPSEDLETDSQVAVAVEGKQLAVGVERGVKLREGISEGKENQKRAISDLGASLQLQPFSTLQTDCHFLLDVSKWSNLLDVSCVCTAKYVAKPRGLTQWMSQDIHVARVVARKESEDGGVLELKCAVVGHLWKGDVCGPEPIFTVAKSGLENQVVLLSDPLLSTVLTSFEDARQEGGNVGSKKVPEVPDVSETGSTQEDSSSSDEDKPDGKTKFKDLDGIVRLCTDRTLGAKTVLEQWSGLFRQLSVDKANWMLGMGSFSPAEVIDFHRDEHTLLTLDIDQASTSSTNQWPLLENMRIVKDVTKFKDYMTNQWHLKDRRISLDDFVRDGTSFVPLIDEASMEGREVLAKNCRGVAAFERTFGSPEVAVIWDDLAHHLLVSVGNKFMLAEMEPLVAAIELAWFKWRKEVYSSKRTSDLDLRTPDLCAERLVHHFGKVIDLYRQGTSDTIFSWRAFYGNGGYWSGVKGRRSNWKPGYTSSSQSGPSFKGSSQGPCLYYLAGKLGVKDENNILFGCGKPNCPRDHVDSASRKTISDCLGGDGTLKESLRSGLNSHLANL